MIVSTAQVRASSVVVFNELAHAVAGATSAFRSPWLALAIGESGKLEAFDADHPSYAAKVAAPGFVCTISPASHPSRIAARIRAAVERYVAA